jgi:probable blue pigment (indigoidine) exporter
MRSASPQRSWNDVLVTALAPAIWGSTYIIATELLPPDRPLTAALLRILPAGIVLLLLARQCPQRQQWPRLLVLAALNMTLFQSLLFVAAYRLPGGLAAVLSAIGPLLVMGLAWIIDKRASSPLALGAAVLGVLGMALLLLSPGTVWDGMGIGAALAGALCAALGTYLTWRWRIDLPLLALTGWQLLAGGLMLAPFAWALDPPLPSLSLMEMLGYGYLSIFGAMLAYTLWFRGIARLSPVAVSSLTLLTPLTAVLLGVAFLGQSITGSALAGLITVFASIGAVQWALSRSPIPVNPV